MRFLLYLCLILTSLGPARAQEEAPSLDALKSDYETKLTELDQPLADLNGNYLEQLKALQDSVQKSGELDKVLAIRAEATSLLELDSPDEQAGTFADLSRLRSIYVREKAIREQQKQREHKELLKQYKLELEPLVQKLTQQNKIDEAKIIVTEMSRVTGLLAAVDHSSVMAPDGVVPGIVRAFGKVRVTGVVPGLEILDASPLSAFSDFVEVKGTSIGFLARRANGDVLNHTGTVIARNIRKILTPPDRFLGIDGDGKIVVIFRGGVPAKAEGVVEATFGWYRAHYLRANGSLQWQGGIYTREKNPRLPPPLQGRSEIKSIAAVGDLDFSLKNGGKVIIWNHQGEVPVPAQLQQDIKEMYATTYNALFINRDRRVLDHHGQFLKGQEIPQRVTAILTGGEMAAFRDFNGHWSVLARRKPFLEEIKKLEHVLNSSSTQDVTFHQRVGAKLDKDKAAYVIWIEAPPG